MHTCIDRPCSRADALRAHLLFNSPGARPCTLAILIAGSAREADGADDLALRHEWNAAIDWNRSFEPQDTQAVSTAGNDVLKGFGRTLEKRRRARLIERYVHAAGLRAVHFFEINQIARRIDDRYSHRPIVLPRFGYRGGSYFLGVFDTDR